LFTAGRVVVKLGQTEKQFEAAVVEYARLHSWVTYHTHDSRRSPEGFPDLVLARGDKLLFAELKSDRGRLSDAQLQWIEVLQRTGAVVCVWRPSDWPGIELILR
jgi:hypothetical protein